MRKGHEFLKYCLNRITSKYNPNIWGTIGPSLIKEAAKEFNNSVNVLAKELFYSIHFSNYKELFNNSLSDYQYNNNYNSALGFHLWSKMLFSSENPKFLNDSILGRLLNSSCLPKVMKCLIL
jgi:hypothetical protein